MVDLNKFIDKDLIGYFWLPNSEEKLQGHLNFSENNILITINGNLPWQNYETLPSGSKRKNMSEIEIFDVICGQVEGLGKVTFFDSYEKTTNMNWVKGSTLFQKQIISSDTFFIGDNFKSKDEIKFDKISFFIEEINNWAYTVCGFKQELITDEVEFKELKLNYSFPSKEEFKFERESKLLSLESNFNQNISRNRKENNFTENIILNLKKENGQLLFEDAIKDIFLLKDLFSLFVNDNLFIKEIYLKKYNSETEKYMNYCQYFIKNSPNKNRKTKFEYEMFILFPDIKNSFEKILNNWFKFREDNNHILTEFFMTNNYSTGYISKFLSYSKILEAFHRNIDDTNPFDKKLIKSINDEIKTKILYVQDEKLLQKYVETLCHVNNYNLQERLDFLFDKFLTGEMKTEFGIDLDFTKDVRQMRNNLTHLNKKVEDLDFNKLHSMNKKLKFIIYIMIFKSISLEDELLLNRLKDSWIKREFN